MQRTLEMWDHVSHKITVMMKYILYCLNYELYLHIK